jgi:hypothetical protein
MQNQNVNQDALQARFERLARTNRILGVAVIALLGLWLAGAAQDEKPKAEDVAPKAGEVVKAQAFQLVDESGVVLAEWGKNKDGSPGLFFKDKEGKTRLSLMNDEKQSALYLFDAEGTSRVGVAHYAFNVSALAIHGPQMKGGASLLYKDRCMLTIDDNENKRLVALPEKK